MNKFFFFELNTTYVFAEWQWFNHKLFGSGKYKKMPRGSLLTIVVPKKVIISRLINFSMSIWNASSHWATFKKRFITVPYFFAVSTEPVNLKSN